MGDVSGYAVRDYYGNIVGYSNAPGGPAIPSISNPAPSQKFLDLQNQYAQQHYANVNSYGAALNNPQTGYSYYNQNATANSAAQIYQQVEAGGGQQNPYVAQKYDISQGVQPRSLTGLSNEVLGRSIVNIPEYVGAAIQQKITSTTIGKPTDKGVPKTNNPLIPLAGQDIRVTIDSLTKQTPQKTQPLTWDQLGASHPEAKVNQPIMIPPINQRNITQNIPTPTPSIYTNFVNPLSSINIRNQSPSNQTYINPSQDYGQSNRDRNTGNLIDLSSGLSTLRADLNPLSSIEQGKKTNKSVGNIYNLPNPPTIMGNFGSKTELRKQKHKRAGYQQQSELSILREMGLSAPILHKKSVKKLMKTPVKTSEKVFWGI
jgi:hypothetical protein